MEIINHYGRYSCHVRYDCCETSWASATYPTGSNPTTQIMALRLTKDNFRLGTMFDVVVDAVLTFFHRKTLSPSSRNFICLFFQSPSVLRVPLYEKLDFTENRHLS
jgi:hypothetical protein